jgi:hypothetical protein
MVTFLLLFFAHPVQAATSTVLAPGTQPLANEMALVTALTAVCGNHLRSDAELSDALETYEECDVVVNQSGFLVRRLLDRVESRTAPLTDSEKESVQEADLTILQSLGFDESEFDNVVTTEVGARDAVEGGTPRPTRYIASKTFVDRSFDGYSLIGSRVVVTRNAEGALVGINATWPAVETGAVLRVTDDALASVDDVPPDLVPGTVRQVLNIIVPVFDDQGVLVSGTVLTEVGYSVYRNEPKTKAVYLLDGVRVNPLSLED